MTLAALVILTAGIVLMAVGAGRLLWRVGRARTAADRFEEKFWSGSSLDDLFAAGSVDHPMGAVFRAGMTETKAGGGPATSMQIMDVVIAREIESLRRGLVVIEAARTAGPYAGAIVALLDLAVVTRSGPIADSAAVMPLLTMAAGLAVGSVASIGHSIVVAALARFQTRLRTFAADLTTILVRP